MIDGTRPILFVSSSSSLSSSRSLSISISGSETRGVVGIDGISLGSAVSYSVEGSVGHNSAMGSPDTTRRCRPKSSSWSGTSSDTYPSWSADCNRKAT